MSIDTTTPLKVAPSPNGFVEIRDSRTQRLICRYNPATHEVEVKQKNAPPLRAVLPERSAS